ncbi:MAG: tRNA (N(6)-L-threonylcarbamoyladenosine(37)-C(2))-methylthiotransferase [Candidatus Hodarchaeota archaeon]
MTGSFFLETYGCSLNKADSDLIVGRLTKLGMSKVSTINQANVIIVNTCGVKEPTEDRIIHRLEELAKGDLPIVVAGCLPRISLTRVERAIPEYAALLGPQSIETLGEVTQRVLAGERGIVHLDSDAGSKLQFYRGPPDSVICTVPICEGCLGDCTYCAVRFARGQVQSFSINEIHGVVERCVHLGYLEIRLTSQDAGVFGHDTGESLVALLKSVNSIEGMHRFRLGMFNPNLVTDYLEGMIEEMSSDNFFQFFHIPLQSGSDRVLQKMGRRYTVNEWCKIVERIREKLPKCTISTDIIVGFPGETDEDFQATIDVIDHVKPGVVNISKYGDRPRTVASRSKEKVHTNTKKAWSRRLSKLVSGISKEENESWIGWVGTAIVTDYGPKGGVVGRNFAYKPIIVNDDIQPGDIVNVEIVTGERTHLIGQVCRE